MVFNISWTLELMKPVEAFVLKRENWIGGAEHGKHRATCVNEIALAAAST